MITYKEMNEDELNRITEIDISEHGTLIYYFKDGTLAPTSEEWYRPQWTTESWREGAWTTLLDRGSIKIWGAFDLERLVGLAVYRPNLTKTTAQLLALFVSNNFRRKGIASDLLQYICRQTKEDGYQYLYVSATPSASAVGFYMAHGFQPAENIHPELYELEPEDIHMVKTL